MYKLLIVDDESLTREYVRMNISSLDDNWQAAGEASDGGDALKFLSENTVDLVITDIKMANMDGLTLCQNICEKYPDIKIVIISGYDEFSFAQQAIRYGVNDYLLKPIDEDELKAVLRKIGQRLDNEKYEKQSLNIISNLSEGYKKNIIKNLLRAVISNSNVEIKFLYPLVHNLKMNILDDEGIIMILSIDKYSMLKNLIPMNNISVFNFILLQITSNVMSNYEDSHEFLDYEENVIVYTTGETKDQTISKCREIYSKVSSDFIQQTGITITGFIGSSQSELLQLNTSYQDAAKSVYLKTLSGGNKVYESNLLKSYSDKVSSLEKSIKAIKLGLIDKNEAVYCESVSDFVGTIDSFDISSILRYGILLINSLKKLDVNFSPELIDMCFKSLQDVSLSNDVFKTKDGVINLYTRIIKILDSNPLMNQGNINETDIISKVKDFIYSHYKEPVSLQQIAEYVGVTTNYLSNLFHKNVGEPYIKFLTRVRMEQAAKLLCIKPQLKIIDISQRVGYVSVKHFMYVFKQFYNITPGEYRDSH